MNIKRDGSCVIRAETSAGNFPIDFRRKLQSSHYHGNCLRVSRVKLNHLPNWGFVYKSDIIGSYLNTAFNDFVEWKIVYWKLSATHQLGLGFILIIYSWLIRILNRAQFFYNVKKVKNNLKDTLKIIKMTNTWVIKLKHTICSIC